MTKAQYRAARALIVNAQQWSQHQMFRYDVQGDLVARDALGACFPHIPTDELAKAAYEISGHWSVAGLNDTADHATVLRMFDRAIELAKE